MTYTIPKPQPSLTLYLFFFLVGIGLIALFLAALFAFSKIMPPYQAFFAAALIEISAVLEALAFIRQKNIPALVGLILSVLVSGTYNYIQAEVAGRQVGIEDGWQLLTLALGPLSALVFTAMQTGRLLREYEDKVEAWEIKRQRWSDRNERRKNRVVNMRNLQANTNVQVTDWRHLSEDEKLKIAEMDVKEIMETYQVTRRSAYNWMSRTARTPSVSEPGNQQGKSGVGG